MVKQIYSMFAMHETFVGVKAVCMWLALSAGRYEEDKIQGKDSEK